MKSRIYTGTVTPNPKGYEIFGMSKFGTVYATEAEFTQVFGEPHESDPSGDRVTKYWHFETPTGRVTVRNWWQNPANELSICAIDQRSCELAAEYFRSCNVKASGGLPT